MITLIILICASIINFLASFLPSTGKTYDNRSIRRGLLKGVTRRGWVVIVCGLLLPIGLFNIQYLINEKETAAKEKASKLEQNKIDSVADQRIEENSKKIIATFTESLAKYGLKYDSAQKVIAQLVRDSTNRVTTVINASAPDFDFCTGNGIVYKGKTGSTYTFEFSFCSLEASSYNINANLFLVTKNRFDQLKLFPGNSSIGHKNLKVSQNTSYKGLQTLFDTEDSLRRVYFLLVGTYTNSDRSKKYKLNSIGYYNFTDKKWGPLHEPEYSEVKKTFNLK